MSILNEDSVPLYLLSDLGPTIQMSKNQSSSSSSIVYVGRNSSCTSECSSMIDEDTGEAACCACTEPCETCKQDNHRHCISCPPDYILIEYDNTCNPKVEWYFPFLAAAAMFFLVVLLVDCCKKSTNFLHSLLFFLAILETTILGYYSWMWVAGEVKGDRSISLVSIGLFILLNLVFIPIHFKLIFEKASEDYL